MILRPNQLHLFAGAAGSGKTTLLMEALHAWEHGLSYPLQFAAKGIAYLSADRVGDSSHTPYDFKRVQFYNLIEDKTWTDDIFDTPTRLLKHALSKITQPFDFLVIDPLALFTASNINDFNKVAKSMVKLGRLAADKHLTILAVHHTKKLMTDATFIRTRDRALGSTAFLAFSDTHITLVQGSEKGVPEDTLEIDPRDSPPLRYYIKRDDDGRFTHFRLETNERNQIVKDLKASGVPTSTAYYQANKFIKKNLTVV